MTAVQQAPCQCGGPDDAHGITLAACPFTATQEDLLCDSCRTDPCCIAGRARLAAERADAACTGPGCWCEQEARR